MIGRTLSHYKVIEKIGQGGMGEVYRAEDTNLSREVAIKVLPEQFTQDPQRLARFEREAKLLASLNHPNIAAIHSFEHSDDIHFLVLELVPGETLAERVAKGPVPVEETLEICRQIAEGVEAAHEKGVIHRDLKPANVKVTPEGKVKILDFGLAKAFEEETPVTDISQSPTLTEEMTRAGVILGTAAYMSPEQAKGKPVDKRADIFAFGAVLYELLTGRKAFEGETITETLGAVLKSEPAWNELPMNTPWRIKKLLDDCLQKEVRDRPHDISHARIQINKALKEPATDPPIGVTSAIQPPLWRRAIPWNLAGLIAIIAVVGFWILTLPTPQPLRKLVITPPSTAPLASYRFTDLAISPDGNQVVYRAEHSDVTQLYVRSMDDFLSTPIVGTEGVDRDFFFSPDGEWIAFVAGDSLKKISLAGGSPITLCDAPSQQGGSWDSEDMIVFAADLGSGTGLYRISANGGEPESLTLPDPDKGERGYQQPEILPNGKAVLFAIWAAGGRHVAVFSLETGAQHILIEGGKAPHYAATGHLVYEKAGTGTLMAVPFDPQKLQMTGNPVPILEGVRQASLGGYATVDYVFSREGTLAYVPAPEQIERSLVWVDRKGTETPVTEEKRYYSVLRVSPDGQSIAVNISEQPGGSNLWIYDLKSDSSRRFTFEGGGTHKWSPDGKWIAFNSRRGGTNHLYRKLADGSGSAEQLTTNAPQSTRMMGSWSPDGILVFMDNANTYILSMDGDSEPELLISGGTYAVLSTDGQWLAYISRERGEPRVYVSRYSEPEVKWQISGEEGGREPVWSPDGTELFYRSEDRMMAVSVETEPTFSAGKPEVLFEGSYLSSESDPEFQYYDIHPDGQRFLMMKEGTAQEQAQINVVLNWFEELKRLVPTP